MRASDQKAFQMLLEKARNGTLDPSKAMSSCRDIVDIATSLSVRMKCERPPHQIVMPQSIGQVTVATTGITASQPIPIEFPGNGRIIGINACLVQSSTGNPLSEDAGHVSLGIEVRGTMNLITNGKAMDFCPLPLISGTTENGRQLYMPVDWPVNVSDKWFATYTSKEPPLTAGGPNIYYATCALFFELDMGV